ncbi:MAG TPA: arylformamidase [Thermoanaerobaculia bacterium]|nr:arylformamidase [Thermoanaerobaculia bacterium]
MIYDISPPLTPATPVWPGDSRFTHEWSCKLATGDSVNLSTLTTTPHIGAHADPPLHSEEGRSGIGELPLAPFLGRCRVIEVSAPDLIKPRHLEGRDLTGEVRVLFKTGSVRGRGTFPPRFTAIAEDTITLLAGLGVQLVGIDTPSVDPFISKTLDVHHALNRHGMVNLEGLDLDRVPPGEYELIALPLRFMGLDASPVRAILRTLH